VAKATRELRLVSLRPDEVGIDVIAQQSLLFRPWRHLKLFPEPAHGAVNPAASTPERLRRLQQWNRLRRRDRRQSRRLLRLRSCAACTVMVEWIRTFPWLNSW